MSDLRSAGVAETARLVAGGEVPVRQVVAEALARIQAGDDELNAFSVVLAEQALAEADALDAADGPVGPLHGVPIAIKEEIDVAGTVTTFGGLANSTPVAADAEVVTRLRAAGAVIIGKTTMPEFGAFPFTESDALGVTRNPWDRTRTPGGSSGGTAAAVSAGMVPAGMGGDGGGSIRIPSASCGLFGLKPQRGRVTTAPHPHLWWALGTAGPLTRSVLDSALIYDAIRGNVAGDLYTAGGDEPFVDAVGRDPGRLRIGWTTKPVSLGVRPDPVHVQAVHDTAALLADLGHDVREVNPRYPDPTAAFVPQFFAGIRTESDLVEHYDRLERRTRETYRLGSWVRPRVIDWALKQTEKVSAKANRVFDEVDVLLTPTLAHRPPKVGRLDGVGTVRAVAALDAVDRLRRAVERRRQPGRLGALRHRRRRAARGGPAGRPHRRRGHAVLGLRPARAGPPVAADRRRGVSSLSGRTVLVTGASSGIGEATARAVAAQGATVLLVARRADELDRVRGAIEAAGGRATSYPCDLTDYDAIDALVGQLLTEHGAVDYLVNNAGRSIRRSIALSYDRFHDIERSMAVNFFGPVRLTLGLLPAMRAQRFGHVVNIVTWGVQMKAPKFSAYIASKTALDSWSRVAARETYGDNVTFTNMRFALVRTAMTAPTEAYAGRGATAEEAARRVVRALEKRPVHVNTFAGNVGELLNLLTPRLTEWLFHRFDRRFPDSRAARGG